MERFETTDFYLACFLRCSGYELVDVQRQGRRSTFIFRDGPARPDDVMAFYKNARSIQPLEFVGAIRDMKALIHNT